MIDYNFSRGGKFANAGYKITAQDRSEAQTDDRRTGDHCGGVDAKTANKIRRTARKVVAVFRARIYVSPAKLELRHETLPTDIAELREADGMLSDLLASRTKISIEEDDKIVN